jgi:hypothetical protein
LSFWSSDSVEVAQVLGVAVVEGYLASTGAARGHEVQWVDLRRHVRPAGFLPLWSLVQFVCAIPSRLA